MAISATGNIQIIANRTMFRGLSASGLPPVVFLQGTSTPNDGGQGFYQVNLTDKTTADNGTSVIVDGGGYRWELVSADTASQIVAALSFGGTLPALDPILGGATTIAAATTTDLSTVTQAAVTVTGSGVTIASLGTLGAGRLRILTFADVNTLDYDATALILPGAANIVTAANDVAGFISLGSGNWQCIWYTEASGGTPGTLPISEGGTGAITAVQASINLSPAGANIASAATINLAAATGPVVTITGSTGPVTSLGTVAAGAKFICRFTGTPTLTHNATSLILPTGTDVVVAAGDVAEFVSAGAGNWYCAVYQRASGLQLAINTVALGGTGVATAYGAAVALSPKGADIASAATIDLATATGPVLDITGATGPVTSLGTVAAGARFALRFMSTPTLTHNATSLILPGGANIVAAAGDTATFYSLGSGNWYCAEYQRATGLPLTKITVALGGTNAVTTVGGYDSLTTQGADIASATTTDIGAATGPYVHITGTTTITGLGTVAAGTQRTVKFLDALTLTYNATSLILPGVANITTATNDTASFVSLGSGNWVCLWYKRASGQPLATVSVAQGGTGDTGTLWTVTNPTVTSSAGTITTVTCTLAKKAIGKTVFFRAIIVVTDNGTGSGHIILPIGETLAAQQTSNGINANTAAGINALSSGTNFLVFTVAGLYPVATGQTLYLNGVIEIA